MNQNDFTWKIGGEAGFGIMTTGSSLAKICTRCGFNIVSNNEYPSLIRGGHNAFTVRASKDKIFALTQKVDILVALNKQTIDLHKNELNKDGVIIYDPIFYTPEKDSSTRFIAVPFSQLAKDNKGDIVMRNTVALGATLAILGMDFNTLKEIINEQFKSKGEEIVKQNINTAKAGYDYLTPTPSICREPGVKRLVLTGNEAVGLGAISSGMKFFAAYPMTPINGLITFLVNHDKKYGYVFKQPEDEISGINMAIGASYAGARSMTATSGGGFALMNEAFSMAGITETPLVVIMGQRPGPASGLPTWTSQGDLKYILHAGHGEFLRFVFAPGDVTECYYLTKLAFNFAEKYQTPVIVLTDKYLSECLFSTDQSSLLQSDCIPAGLLEYSKTIDRGKIVDKPTPDYKRYKIETDGISPRLFPGKGMWFTTNSYEHDEAGLSTENAEEIKAMVDKRKFKSALAQKDAFGPILYGPEKAETTLVGWGSTKMAALEVIRTTGNINYLHFPCLSPFPSDNTLAYLQKAKRIIDVENNSEGPLADLIREKTGVLIESKILKYDGRQFYPEEILNYVNH